MIFKNTQYAIWFFIGIPVIALMFLGYKKRFHRLSSMISTPLWNRIIPHLSYSRRFWKRFLLIISLLFVLIALLRPQYGVVFKTVERRGHDIYIAIDTSKSMLAQDTQPSRLEHAKREVLGLIDELKGDRIGLIAFAGDAFIQCPLTTDYAALKMYLDFLDAGVVPTPGTDIATAIKTARLSFNRVSKGNKRVLIILSDGESFENDPVKSAEVAFDQDITIYTIGVGTPTGEPIPEFNEAGQLIGYKKDKQNQVVLSKINEGLLKQVAQTAEGAYFSSSLGQFVMDEVYKDISQYEQKRLEEELLTLNKDQYQWFLAIAFLALLLETFIADRKRRLSDDWEGRLSS